MRYSWDAFYNKSIRLCLIGALFAPNIQSIYA
ncbi:hypothetical protein HMPREF1475_01075 [Hoylesella oralis HGA0225]|nr:hypothetical protein HMPREF1475_01075 [Hoylesella oralis HGA0225]SHF95899.1 hypothetical protein SAMN05444288_1970 [Hoylesella oralis]